MSESAKVPWHIPEAFNAASAIDSARAIADSCTDPVVREAFHRTLDELERLRQREGAST